METLPGWLMALLIGGALALVLGYFVARKSARRKPIQGGTLSHVFHYLGAVATVAPAPVLFVGAFLYQIDFGQTVGLCLGSLGSGFLLLMVFAFFESLKGRAGQPSA